MAGSAGLRHPDLKHQNTPRSDCRPTSPTTESNLFIALKHFVHSDGAASEAREQTKTTKGIDSRFGIRSPTVRCPKFTLASESYA